MVIGNSSFLKTCQNFLLQTRTEIKLISISQKSLLTIQLEINSILRNTFMTKKLEIIRYTPIVEFHLCSINRIVHNNNKILMAIQM